MRTMTIKEISDALGVSMTAVTGFVKKTFPGSVHNGRPTMLDEEQCATVLDHFKHSSQIHAENGNYQKSKGGNLQASFELQNLQSVDSIALLYRDAAGVMARLNNMVKALEAERNALAIELDQAKEWWSVKRVLIETGEDYPWRPLKNYSDAHGYEIRKAFDANYKQVNTYHIEVWHAVYGLEL